MDNGQDWNYWTWRAAELIAQDLAVVNCTYSSTPTPERDALVDIAYDCPTLEIAQERARQALR